MARFAVGHTPEIAARHYADIPSLRPLHEATVAEALTELSPAGRSFCHPTASPFGARVLTPLCRSITFPRSWMEIRTSGSRRARAFRITPSPKQAHPVRSHSGVAWNAATRSSRLASCQRSSRFSTLSRARRAGLSAADWSIKFGRAHAHHTAILPVFSERLIAQARSGSHPNNLSIFRPRCGHEQSCPRSAPTGSA